MVFKATVNWKDELENIRNLGLEGKTLREIGAIYSVSKQTIDGVIKRYSIFKTGELYGQAVRTQQKKDNYFAKWGVYTKDDLYSSCRYMLSRKKYNAAKKGIPFDVEFTDIVFPTHCPILGIELDYFSDQGRKENNPSFDRKDSSKGYVKGNVFVISWRANRIKNDGTAEEHRQIAEWMQK